MAIGKGVYWWGLVLVLSLALIAFGLVWTPQSADRDQGHQTLPLATAPQGGDFVLSRDGQAFNLADYRGQVVLLYFGYTHCPDVCPTSMVVMRQVLRPLDAAELERVQGVFVSVDPERDSAEQLAEYAAFFHPGILGVTGSAEQLAAAGRRYGAAWQRVDSGSEMGYSVDHSSYIYVIGPDGRLVETVPHGTASGHILEAVRDLLEEE
ncbi:MAG: SCO family protein [Thioalkalivibrio sp.]|nr:MAG: SCO family protein [Thioalkalivibrio sp.]